MLQERIPIDLYDFDPADCVFVFPNGLLLRIDVAAGVAAIVLLWGLIMIVEECCIIAVLVFVEVAYALEVAFEDGVDEDVVVEGKEDEALTPNPKSD